MKLRLFVCDRLIATIMAALSLLFCAQVSTVGYGQRGDVRRLRANNATPYQTPRTRAKETNDGALPPADDFDDLELDASALHAAPWSDPATSSTLRARALEIAKERRARWPQFSPVRESEAEALGIRRVSAGRVTLHTDLPKSREIDSIPDALEAAIPELCNFFHIDATRFDNLQIDAFLMADVDRFIEYGALEGAPRFLYGYSYGDRIYAKDQGIGYYNRFLLTHELTHTIMHELFGDLRPRWFSEGAAEYLALHTWKPGIKKIEIAQIPESEELTPGFGRLRFIRKLVADGDALALKDILAFEPRDYVDVSAYAWSWALVMFLYNSPKYRDVAELLPYWMTAPDPNNLLIEAIGDRWGELEYDWANFITTLDYRYDFESSAIVRAARRDYDDDALRRGVVVDVDPSKGWQSVGVTLEGGRKYRVAAAGRFMFYLASADKTLEFEAPGATCEYVAGRPVGRLLAVVAPDVAGLTYADVYGADASLVGRQSFRFDSFRGRSSSATRFGDVVDSLYPWRAPYEFRSSHISIEPDKDGELFLRVNASSGELAKNQGKIKVQVKLKE